MATPNLVNVATIIPSNIGFNLTNATNSKLITPATDKVIKINTITVANVDETNDATIDLYVDEWDRWNRNYKHRYRIFNSRFCSLYCKRS